MKKNVRGFTLIELMVVVIVIAILAALAIPSYLSQVRKSRRNAAEGAMQQIALLEERYRADCSTFCDASTTPSGCSTCSWSALGGDPGSSYYSYAITVASTTTAGATYTITATGASSQLKDTASGTSCANLYYAFGQDASVDTACSLSGTNVTANGKITQCPLACWNK